MQKLEDDSQTNLADSMSHYSCPALSPTKPYCWAKGMENICRKQTWNGLERPRSFMEASFDIEQKQLRNPMMMTNQTPLTLCLIFTHITLSCQTNLLSGGKEYWCESGRPWNGLKSTVIEIYMSMETEKKESPGIQRRQPNKTPFFDNLFLKHCILSSQTKFLSNKKGSGTKFRGVVTS